MARKPASDEKILSRRVLVTLVRDQTAATPRVVYQHEIPLLEVLFGEGNAKPVDPEALDEGFSTRPSADMLVHNKRQDPIPRPSESAGLGHVFIGDPRGEFERLAACYGMHPEVKVSVVEHVYGRFAEGRFSAVVGGPDLSDLPPDQLRELTRQWGGDPDAIKAADTREKLLALAEETGVQIGG
jgi:hypothetical protein